MKRLVVKFIDGDYCNMRVSRIEKIDSVVFAYDGENFIGMFDLGTVACLYISEGREREK